MLHSQPLTLIYCPTKDSKIEFQIRMTKEELLSHMYLASATDNTSFRRVMPDDEKEAVQSHLKKYFSKPKHPACCGFWASPTFTSNIKVIKLGRNTPRKIYTDFSNDLIDITAWINENNITPQNLQELFKDENKNSLICLPWISIKKKNSLFCSTLEFYRIPRCWQEFDPTPSFSTMSETRRPSDVTLLPPSPDSVATSSSLSREPSEEAFTKPSAHATR